MNATTPGDYSSVSASGPGKEGTDADKPRRRRRRRSSRSARSSRIEEPDTKPNKDYEGSIRHADYDYIATKQDMVEKVKADNDYDYDFVDGRKAR